MHTRRFVAWGGVLVLAMLPLIGCGGDADDDPFTRDPKTGISAKPQGQKYVIPDGNSGEGPVRDAECIEGVGTSRGENEEPEYAWAQGTGCIKKPIREVWAAAHSHAFMQWLSSRKISSVVSGIPVPPGATHAYRLDYHVDDIIDVDWTMDWVHALLNGEYAAPKELIINYKKVRGTAHIPYWEGTIWLDYVSPNVTAFAMRDHVNARNTGPEDAEGAVRDVYEKLRTGPPIWEAIGGR